jgi:hypothetical protein
MTWVTWRQHRLEGIWALVVVVLIGGAIAFVANEIRIAGCPGPGQTFCLLNDPAGQLALVLARLNIYQYGLVVLPALAGAFFGAPLVAREIEAGTQRLAWTQGVTRLRWLMTKVVLVFVPLLVLAGLLGGLEVWLVNVQGPEANHWAVFDQHAPVTVAATFFALALGLAAGAVLGRSVVAMAVTLFVFVGVRVGIAELARPNYMAALLHQSHDLSGIMAPGSSWWLDNPDFRDAAGHSLGSSGPGAVSGSASYFVQYYQPGDRFWAFQTIESAILAVLGLAILLFAVYWVTRRVV